MTKLILAFSVLFAAPVAQSPALPAIVLKADGLAGCWHHSGERGNPSIRLNWTRAASGLMTGTWIKVPQGFEPEYSFLRIESTPAVALVWQAPGEPPTRLALDSVTPASGDRVAFVNPGAGLPKRVEFVRGKSEALLVSALYEGTKALETPMKKVKCGEQ